MEECNRNKVLPTKLIALFMACIEPIELKYIYTYLFIEQTSRTVRIRWFALHLSAEAHLMYVPVTYIVHGLTTHTVITPLSVRSHCTSYNNYGSWLHWRYADQLQMSAQMIMQNHEFVVARR